MTARELAAQLRAAGEDVLSPAATRVLLSCFATASPSGLVRMRDVRARTGFGLGGGSESGVNYGVIGHFERLAAAGFLETLDAKRKGTRPHTRYRLACSLTLYRARRRIGGVA